MGPDLTRCRAGTRAARAAARVAVAIMALALLPVNSDTRAVAQGAAGCTRTDFEQVVDQAAAALAELNAKKTPAFQGLLRQLKTKRNWSHAEFIKSGTPYVQDDQIADYDAKSNDLLASIADKGERGASAATPDCKLLDELRGTMKTLVATQIAKWDYMYAKLDRALKE